MPTDSLQPQQLGAVAGQPSANAVQVEAPLGSQPVTEAVVSTGAAPITVPASQTPPPAPTESFGQPVVPVAPTENLAVPAAAEAAAVPAVQTPAGVPQVTPAQAPVPATTVAPQVPAVAPTPQVPEVSAPKDLAEMDLV